MHPLFLHQIAMSKVKETRRKSERRTQGRRRPRDLR
jgi:hypothetical protein